MANESDIDKRLHGTRNNRIIQEFFTNTAYFPIANILLESLIQGPQEYFHEPGLYVLLWATMVQAYFLGSWQFSGYPKPLLGNLIGPTLYTGVEMLSGELDFFHSPYHIAFWSFAIAIGVVQQLRLHVPTHITNNLIILENIIRTNILLVMYWIYEFLTEPRYSIVTNFFAQDGHLFLALTINFMGIMMGIAHRNAEIFLQLLKQTSQQLRRYSEFLLGKNILAMAVADPNSLSLNRRERTVLFMDIRGFTQWSESQSPEKVVMMINAYCETAEQCWEHSDAIKVKLTGDEIMIVFQTPSNAIQVAIQLKQAISQLLKHYDLSIGIGIHTGLLVEGLLGSNRVKTYDIIGDTVNTAKRICDTATRDEVLISETVYQALHPSTTQARQVKVKGKAEPITVFPLSLQS